VRNLGVEAARAEFERLDQRCKDAGLNGVYLVFCEGYILDAQGVTDSFAAGARAFCLYNYRYAGTEFTGPNKGGEASYADLVTQGEGLWKHWSGITEGRFWPTVMAGWDRRPWTKDQDLVRTGMTPELFGDSLRRGLGAVNAQKMLLVEAWNEWGEGSVLEPDQGNGFAYLEQVRDAIAPGAGAHTDPTPDTVGVPRPQYPMDLPAKSRWFFNYADLDEWTAVGTDQPVAAMGALQAVTTTGDPQFTSALSYLKCAEYSRLHVRMRLTPAKDDPATEATGQMFWSTVETGLSGKCSVTFTVKLDDEWHDYDVELAGAPGWTGVTDRFRFDPVNVAGVKVWVDDIEFLK
jgi:hypothetical protein